MAPLLETLRKIQRREHPHPPVCELLGISLISVEPGRTRFQMLIDDRCHNLLGTVHGGIYCDLADVAMGFAFASILNDGEGFTTVEFKINYLKPVRAGIIIAEGRVVSSGRTLGLVECDLWDGGRLERLVARAGCTCMRLQAQRLPSESPNAHQMS
jgi:uncharacterized protein (TIGR00369 family)